jgi:dTDP-4-dehydrorhamnose 3,5-epimerase
MIVENLHIDGLVVLHPRRFSDSRGYFFETFNAEKYAELLGDDVKFVQDNVSVSKKNVLRGLHFQSPPAAQGKLVSVLQGKVIDVAVDLRKNSKTYGQHVAIELSAENGVQFWIPEGFAHGFAVLEENTIFSYKCTKLYSPENEVTIMWNDLNLQIDWGIDNPIVSDKDGLGLNFTTFVTQF